MAGEADVAFRGRLLRRRERWWGNPFRWARFGSYPEAIHRFRERHTFRAATDPDPVWRCCDCWRRSLVNKWNGREFARKHAPACLGEMLDFSRRLGRALGTYMRIDFFSTDRGCVFNEFSSTPQIWTLKYAPYCNELFGRLRAETFPLAT